MIVVVIMKYSVTIIIYHTNQQKCDASARHFALLSIKSWSFRVRILL